MKIRIGLRKGDGVVYRISGTERELWSLVNTVTGLLWTGTRAGRDADRRQAGRGREGGFMATKLGRPVTRGIETGLRAKGFRDGFVARMVPEGVLLKPARGRWKGAYLCTWGDALVSGAVRKAEEDKEARKLRRKGVKP
jgi:hypothetical protein